MRRTAVKDGVCSEYLWRSHVSLLITLFSLSPDPMDTFMVVCMVLGCIFGVWIYHVLDPDIVFTTSYLRVCLCHVCARARISSGWVLTTSDEPFYLDSTHASSCTGWLDCVLSHCNVCSTELVNKLHGILRKGLAVGIYVHVRLCHAVKGESLS